MLAAYPPVLLSNSVFNFKGVTQMKEKKVATKKDLEKMEKKIKKEDRKEDSKIYQKKRLSLNISFFNGSFAK